MVIRLYLCTRQSYSLFICVGSPTLFGKKRVPKPIWKGLSIYPFRPQSRQSLSSSKRTGGQHGLEQSTDLAQNAEQLFGVDEVQHARILQFSSPEIGGARHDTAAQMLAEQPSGRPVQHWLALHSTGPSTGAGHKTAAQIPTEQPGGSPVQHLSLVHSDGPGFGQETAAQMLAGHPLGSPVQHLSIVHLQEKSSMNVTQAFPHSMNNSGVPSHMVYSFGLPPFWNTEEQIDNKDKTLLYFVFNWNESNMMVFTLIFIVLFHI